MVGHLSVFARFQPTRGLGYFLLFHIRDKEKKNPLSFYFLQDVCIAAVKERDIDFKLKGVVSEWSTQVFSFSNFKNRGELLLKGAETSDIVSLMEDSLMILGSLLSNR